MKLATQTILASVTHEILSCLKNIFAALMQLNIFIYTLGLWIVLAQLESICKEQHWG